MPVPRPFARRFAWCFALAACVPSAEAAFATGARLYKSGPIQITADGSAVWAANLDNDSVSRLLTTTEAVLEVPLADPTGSCSPRGLAVSDDGREVWVACHDSDRVVVLDGTSGTQLASLDLPWGTGPHSVVMTPPWAPTAARNHVVVTGFRGSRLVVIERTSRRLVEVVEPVFHSPIGLTFDDAGIAWVTHLFADGEHPRLTRVDLSDPANPKVTTKIRVFPAQPQNSFSTAPRRAEGGYLTLRGHPAQVPAGKDQGRLWLPVQYQNIHDNDPQPDSTIQSSLRKVAIGERRMADGANFASNPDFPAKVILTAVDVHDPISGGAPVYDGAGWNAQVGGPVDLAFSADGNTAWVLHEHSEDVVVLPTSTPPVKPGGASPLVEIPVGRRPMGLVVSPVAERAYVLNILSRSISVLDLAAGSELKQIAITPVTGEPLSPTLKRGAEIFHTSNEDAVSLNRKVACASCHLGGEHDGRSWDLQHLPGAHGTRQTQTLAGLGATYGPVDPATGWGQLHRSGDRDEVQDFEHTLRGPQMGGVGFLASPNPSLGPANAGLDSDLDALAAYVLSLPAPPRSPYRAAGGGLSAAAVRGATFFNGSDPARAADAQCATCHVPATGFVDHGFHNVGQMVLPGEGELNSRSPSNYVNTAGLVGLWMTSPYEGVTREAFTIPEVLQNFRDRPGNVPAHGWVGGLTGRQLRDLSELILSLDGETTAAEVTTARDTAPPRVLRVAPTSPSRLEVWLDESVERAAAENPSAWSLRDAVSGRTYAVLAASLDTQNADRVTLTVEPLAMGCLPTQYQLRALGPIPDLADRASGGTANILRDGPPFDFSLGDEIEVTLGASGGENLTVPVHDASTLPGLTQWSHGSEWLLPDATNPSTGLLRFEWAAAFQAATGMTSSEQIVDAAILLQPDLGDAQVIEARRVLLPWFDHRGPDWNSHPVDPATGRGGPTWRQAERGVRNWNQPNARATAPGVNGDDAADYGGGQDTAHLPDASASVETFHRPWALTGAGVRDAFRFWFDHPGLDYGYALRLQPGTIQDVRFHASESGFGDRGPVLRLTWRVAGACDDSIFADGFESAGTSAWSAASP